MKHAPLPPFKTVAEVLEYDPETGQCVRKSGKGKGTAYTNGYQTARIGGRRYNITRLCWLLATETDPGDYEVDHIDRNPNNNKLNNLRLASRTQQLANRKRSSKRDLPKGVSFNKARNNYEAAWGENGNKVSVKGFKTAEEAHLFYLWNTRHHGEFAEPLVISACPPRPKDTRKDTRKRGTENLPKSVSRVRQYNRDGTSYLTEKYLTAFVNKEGVRVCKKGFKTPEEAYAFYLEHRKE